MLVRMASQAGSGRRVIAFLLAGALAIAVIAGIAVSAGLVGGGTDTVIVKGLSGSEKLPFFQDDRVVKRLRELGFEVQVEAAGSRQIATDFDLKLYDFGFPAGVPAAEKIRREIKTKTPYTTFFTPMVVASFTPIAELLVKNGVASKQGDHYLLDMHRYLTLAGNDTRWKELRGNSAYPVDKSVLITSTDVRRSNSAAMYLSLTSFIANGDNVVANSAQANTVLPIVTPLFLKQGFVESSSEGPFEDYLTIGMGKTPLVMIYEAQFVARAAAEDGSISKDMVMLYPEPTILSKHTFVPFTEDGDRLGKALANDPELQQLAVEYGFRTAAPGALVSFAKQHGLTLPATLLNVIDPPSYEALEHMITSIEAQYKTQSVDTGP
jgi:hypothetical protein